MKPLTKTKQVLQKLWPYMLVAFIIGLRNYTALLRPEFWAEDADQFFVAALNDGVRSIFVPAVGVHCLISRMLAYSATFFPLLWTPLIYSVSTLALNAFVTGYFAREGFSWLIPSRTQRAVACSILAMGPGTSEVFANIVNLGFCLSFLFLLLLLEQPLTISWRRFAGLLLLITSAAQMSLFIPMIIYVFSKTKHRPYLWLLAAFIPITAINFMGTLNTSMHSGLYHYEFAVNLPRVLTEQGIVRLVFMPMLGRDLTGSLMRLRAFIFWPILILGLCLFFVALLKRLEGDRKRVRLLTIAYLCANGVFGVILISRGYATEYLQRQSGLTFWGMRYSYLPGQVALLIWFCICFCRHWESVAGRYLRFMIFMCLLGWNIQQWGNVYRRPDLHWPQTAEDLGHLLDLSSKGLLNESQTIRGMKAHPEYYHHARMLLIIDPGGKIKTKPEPSGLTQ